MVRSGDVSIQDSDEIETEELVVGFMNGFMSESFNRYLDLENAFLKASTGSALPRYAWLR